MSDRYIPPRPAAFDSFKDLIFCPLDLPTPPDIDENKLFDYIKMRHERDRGTLAATDFWRGYGAVPLDSPHIKHTSSWSKAKDTYPWRLIHLMRGDFGDNGWEYYPEFKEHLPELADFIDQLPFDEFYTISLLNQKPGVDVGIHTDPDIWFGIRFYLINRSPARIFFNKAKNPTTERLVNTIRKPDGLVKQLPWEQVVDEEKIYPVYPQPKFVFHLSNSHATHGVEAVPEEHDDSRITLFFIGRVNPTKYAELMERSLKKYKDYAIWW